MSEIKSLSRHARDLRRSLANRKYEYSPEGLVLPEQKLLIGGVFSVRKNDEAWEHFHNKVVNGGLTYLLSAGIANGTKIGTWYLAPFKGNVTPLASWTAANFTANSTELTEYDESTRQTFVTPGASAQNVNNTASPAVITINATVTAYGAALISNSAKSGTTGTLLSAGLFSTPKALADDDTLSIAYSLTATSTT
jgi:predicted RecA/RadA family phage recombinase